MSILLVAGIWLSLGVIFCFVSGRGIAAGQAPATAEPLEPSGTPAAPTAAPRQFATLAVHEWALAAANDAAEELLSTRPGAIRRVAAR